MGDPALWDAPLPDVPMVLPATPTPQLFTVDQVADAVSAALEARDAGEDPREAARAAIAGGAES